MPIDWMEGDAPSRTLRINGRHELNIYLVAIILSTRILPHDLIEMIDGGWDDGTVASEKQLSILRCALSIQCNGIEQGIF